MTMDSVPANMTLFKYRSVNAHLIDLLQEGYLYFSNPATFNDPFEFRAYLDQLSNLKLSRKDLEDELAIREPGLTWEKRRRKAAWLLGNPGFRKGISSIQHLSDDLRQTVCIFCMSEVPDCILQWSHYGDNHCGIVLEIDPGNDSVIARSKPVVYTDEYPTVEVHLEFSDEDFLKVGFTKSLAWSYEKEWRAIHPNSGPFQRHQISQDTLKSITFGARTTMADRERVAEVAKFRFPDIRFYAAELGTRTYSVKICSAHP